MSLYENEQLCFFTQGMSLSPFGGLFSYPYHCMAAPAAVAPAHPTCSATSSPSRNHHSSRPWMRFNPYQIPTSVNSCQSLLTSRSTTTRSPGTSNSQHELSKSGVRSPVSGNHTYKGKAKQKTSPSKTTLKDSINELQNIHY